MVKLSAFLAGALFSIGLVIGGMTQPAKVIGFLDLAGNWDPSLALVMMGAIPIAAIGYRLARRRSTPVYGTSFPDLPQERIDRRLLGGAVLFGAGWGIGGYCPGPGVVAVVSLSAPALMFCGAMVAGMSLFSVAEKHFLQRRPEPAQGMGSDVDDRTCG